MAIGVITNHATSVFQAAVIAGIREIAEHENLEVLVDSRLHSDTPENITDFDTSTLQGLIVVANAVPDDFVSDLYHQKLPISLVSHHIANTPIPSVGPNNTQGIKQLVSHIVHSCGRQQIVFIDGHLEQADGIERRQAFLRERIRHNISDEPVYLLQGDFDVATAESSLRDFLTQTKEFDTVIAADYLMAIAAIEVLQAHGYRVPEDVSVVGFGDGVQARDHQLTTIAADIEELGRRSARQLIGQINGLDIRGTTLLSVALQIRASCGYEHLALS